MQSGKTTYKTRESLQDLNCNLFKQIVQRTRTRLPKIYFGTPVAGTDAGEAGAAGDAATGAEPAAGAEAGVAATGAVDAAPSTPADGFT